MAFCRRNAAESAIAQRQRVAERSDQGDVPRHDHQDRRQPDPPLDDAEDGEHGNGHEREGEPPAEHRASVAVNGLSTALG